MCRRTSGLKEECEPVDAPRVDLLNTGNSDYGLDGMRCRRPSSKQRCGMSVIPSESPQPSDEDRLASLQKGSVAASLGSSRASTATSFLCPHRGLERITKCTEEPKQFGNSATRIVRSNTRISVGERLLRKLQLQVEGRVPQRRDLPFDQRTARAGRTLARPLQHHKATLFAGLSITGTRGMADKQHGVWGDGGYLNSEIAALH